jgi:hypothetical protein
MAREFSDEMLLLLADRWLTTSPLVPLVLRLRACLATLEVRDEDMFQFFVVVKYYERNVIVIFDTKEKRLLWI